MKAYKLTVPRSKMGWWKDITLIGSLTLKVVPSFSQCGLGLDLECFSAQTPIDFRQIAAAEVHPNRTEYRRKAMGILTPVWHTLFCLNILHVDICFEGTLSDLLLGLPLYSYC